MRIRDLVLHTSNFEKQYHFYIDKLGFPLVEKWNSAFCFRVGRSHFTFQEVENELKVYHFAFGLKENRIQVALKTLRERVEIIPNHENGEEIVDFPAWNAKSVYFYDPDGNVVEFISRCNTISTEQSSFSISDVKGVCEIGLPVDCLKKTYLQLKKAFKLQKCPGHSKLFCPLGDQEGMIILVQEKQKQWFPTRISAQKSDFKAFIETNYHSGEISCQNGNLNIF